MLKSVRHTYFLATLLALFVALTGASWASDCQSMPCCIESKAMVETQATCETALPTDKIGVCGESLAGGCSCSIQDDPPAVVESKAAVSFFVFEIELSALDELILPSDTVAPEPREPYWTSPSEFRRSEPLVSFAALPNPPPAAA